MKVSGDSGAKPPATGGSNAAKPAKTDRARTFDSVLDRKRQPDDSAAAIPTPAFALRNDVTPVETAPGTAGIPAPLESLVNELVSVAAPDGTHWVDIQFDSKTLQGLHVRVTRSSEGVSVRFNAASDDVARLLSQNIGRLEQALEAKGVPVPALRIETGPAPAAFQDRRSDSGGRERRQGGDQQRQGGQQNRR